MKLGGNAFEGRCLISEEVLKVTDLELTGNRITGVYTKDGGEERKVEQVVF